MSIILLQLLSLISALSQFLRSRSEAPSMMNYDLVLRSDLVGIDKAVECIKNYVEAM